MNHGSPLPNQDSMVHVTAPGFDHCYDFFWCLCFRLILSMASPTGWWFQILFIFTPTWGNDPIWLYNIFQIDIFSDGLKPPTRSPIIPKESDERCLTPCGRLWWCLHGCLLRNAFAEGLRWNASTTRKSSGNLGLEDGGIGSSSTYLPSPNVPPTPEAEALSRGFPGESALGFPGKSAGSQKTFISEE